MNHRTLRQRKGREPGQKCHFSSLKGDNNSRSSRQLEIEYFKKCVEKGLPNSFFIIKKIMLGWEFSGEFQDFYWAVPETAH